MGRGGGGVELHVGVVQAVRRAHQGRDEDKCPESRRKQLALLYSRVVNSCRAEN